MAFWLIFQSSKKVKNNISFDLLQNTTSQQGFPAATRETQEGKNSNISFDVLQNMILNEKNRKIQNENIKIMFVLKQKQPQNNNPQDFSADRFPGK